MTHPFMRQALSGLLLVLVALCSLPSVSAIDSAITISPPEMYPPEGTFSGDVTVTLVANQPHANVYWTRDGTTPSNKSRLYTEPIYLFEPGTWNVQAIAVPKTGNLGDSVVISRSYTVTPSTISIPRVTPAKGKYRGFVMISLVTDELPQEPTEADKTKREVKIQYVVDVENPGNTWLTFADPFPLDIPGVHIVKSRIAVTTTFIPIGKTEPQTKTEYSPVARYRYEITPALLYDVSTECPKCANVPTVGKYFSIFLQNPEPNSRLFLTTSSKGCAMDRHILDDTEYVNVALRQVVYRFVTYTEPQHKVFVCLREPSNVNQTYVTVARRPRANQQGIAEASFAIEPAFGAIKKQETAAPTQAVTNLHPSAYAGDRSTGGSMMLVFGGLCIAIVGVGIIFMKMMRGGSAASGGRRTALRTHEDE